AARFADRRVYWFVGGGPNTATAWEAALKMCEASHAAAVGFNCEQFLHGAWAALEREDMVVLVAPRGASRERCGAVARGGEAVGGRRSCGVGPARGRRAWVGGGDRTTRHASAANPATSTRTRVSAPPSIATRTAAIPPVGGHSVRGLDGDAGDAARMRLRPAV